MSQIKFQIPKAENMRSGHVACPGCGATLSMRYAMKALGLNTMIVIPACCWSIIDGLHPVRLIKYRSFTPPSKRPLLRPRESKQD